MTSIIKNMTERPDLDYIQHCDMSIRSSLNFLIVEDENDVADVLQIDLEEMGFNGKFFIANSVEEAQELALKEDINFIISDWNLEGLSGLDLLIYLRKKNQFDEIPFLMLTANDNVSGMLVATKRGADEYLVKPWSHSELKDKIFLAWEGHHRIPTLPAL